MSTTEEFDNAKIAIALRAARTGIGWNQQEFADLMGVAKSTIARIETMEMAAKGDFLVKAIGLFRSLGLELELFSPGKVEIKIEEPAIQKALAMLKDESRRRADRRMKSGIASLLPDGED